ncbi:hypothetical protein LOD99_14919 [Oopsacas minuta]|uniref:Uncharacterized protein n=1 Tax=Oopsacas minuta TaxID=111878 RepID=A0AAV7KFX6_9METZ|nr:hypothetical protein LOD99_14919 [Oopsacas minuta]
MEDTTEEQAPDTGDQETADKDEDATEDKEEAPPKPNYKPPPVIPKEEFGTGTNKKVYFVCNDAGSGWTRLPPITPTQIIAARQIRKFFTGDLAAKVFSYPPFPGNEGNYLRAQIARISATTHISPSNFYLFDADEEDEMDARDTFAVNEEFENIPVNELVDDSLSRWVHHVQFILPQGRCVWFNPLEKPDDQFDDEDEDDDDKDGADEPQPEEGPPLLTPLSEDKEVDGMPSWSPSLSSSLIPSYSIAIIQSNQWPGASAFCINKKFENVYIGWGQKYSSHPINPMLPPSVQDEYPEGPDILEAEDPTVEQETLLRVAQEGKLGEGEDEDPEDDDD